MIALDGVTLRYGRDTVLSGVTHAFAPGTSTALVGPSGAGKSTLLYVLGLLLTPQEGVVRVGGTDVVALPERERAALRARTIGFVFQDALLDRSRSVLDNVLQGVLFRGDGRAGAQERARELLARFGVPEAGWGRRPGQISGGQAQRVALCRALVGSPALLLGDEPTGNLDDGTGAVVWEALAGAARGGATVVVATHDRARAERCDVVLEVDGGAVR